MGQRTAAAVEDFAARRREQAFGGPVVLGAARITIAFEHLQLHQAARQHPDHADLNAAQKKGAAANQLGAAAHARHHALPFSAAVSRTASAAATTG